MKYTTQPISRRTFLKGVSLACASLAALQLGIGSLRTSESKVRYEYDASGRLKSVTYPDGSKVEYAYDKTGGVTYAEHHRAKFYLA